MIALALRAKLPSTRVVQTTPEKCAACSCVRIERKRRTAIDRLTKRTARYKCRKCEKITLVWVAPEIKAVAEPLPDRNTQLVADKKYALACNYAKGSSGQKNLKAAYLLLIDAAEKGHVKAQLNLGMFYARGIGTEENREMAEYWLGKAAEMGDKRAIEMAARMHD